MRDLDTVGGREKSPCWTVTARERKSVREEEREKGKGRKSEG